MTQYDSLPNQVGIQSNSGGDITIGGSTVTMAGRDVYILHSPSALPHKSSQPSHEKQHVPLQNYIGRGYAELEAWLSHTWLIEGPPVCFVQGFSGVGKSSLARSVMKNAGRDSVKVDMPTSSSTQIDDLFLDLAAQLSDNGINTMADAVEDASSLPRALEKVVRKNILIIIDEFQNALDASGRSIEELANILDRVANRTHLPGRLLLLSNRIVERGRWSEVYSLKTLVALEPEEAEMLLDTLLKEVKRSQAASWLVYPQSSCPRNLLATAQRKHS